MNTVKHVPLKPVVTALAVVIVLALAVAGRHDVAVAAVTAWHWYFTVVRAIWTHLTAVLS